MPQLRGDLYTDIPMTRAAVAGFQRPGNFVAPFAFPRMMVNKPSGLYYKWLLADLNRNEMEARGDYSPAPIANFGKTTATFSVPTESLGYDLNDVARLASDQPIDPSKVIPRVLAYKALLRFEAMVGALVTTGVWYRLVSGGASDSVTEGTTSTRKRWSDTSSDPIAQIVQEQEFQGKLTGFEPNALLFGRKAWTSFRTHPVVLATLTGSTGMVRNKPASLQEVATLLDLKYVGVSKAIYNSAARGLTASNARLVPEDNALLYYRGEADGEDPGEWNDEIPVAAACPVWEAGAGNREGLRVRTFRKEEAGPGGSDHSEIDTFRTVAAVTSEMGTLFTDMTA
jgi:hypothetical protein